MMALLIGSVLSNPLLVAMMLWPVAAGWPGVPAAPAGVGVLSQEFDKFGRGVIDFALLGIPAAVVNSGLKFMQKNLELSFQSRLTHYLHRLYTSNRAYYAASTLGGLTHADQRITEDVEKFCFSVSDLYSHTFKVSCRGLAPGGFLAVQHACSTLDGFAGAAGGPQMTAVAHAAASS